jgi:hypothetical protein
MIASVVRKLGDFLADQQHIDGGGDVLGSFGPDGMRRALGATRQVGTVETANVLSQCTQLLGLSQRAVMLCHPRIVGSYFA